MNHFKLPQSTPSGVASSLNEGKGQAFGFAKGPISEGAVAEGDWGS